MTVGSDTLDFCYDAKGMPLTVTHNGTVYSYITNLQGDVMSVQDSYGGSVAQYAYDAWGNILESQGDLAELNPLRYRGYVYDQETGFYYVSSRYYDSTIGRFVNADDTAVLIVFLASPREKNLFAYCKNNPVSFKDVTGTIADTALDVAFIAGDIASIISNPANVVGYAELAADFVGLVAPGFTGGGKIVRAVMNSSDVLKASKVANKIVDSKKIIKGISGEGIKFHNIYDPIKKAATGKNKLLGKALTDYGSKLKPDAVDFTNRIIYELKPYNKNAYKRALKQANRYANTMGGQWKIVIDMYR